ETGASSVQRAGAVFYAFGARPRPRRKFFGLPEANFRKLWLGSRSSGFGVLAQRACGRPRGASDRATVRSLGTENRLFGWAAVARRRIPHRLTRTAPMAVSVKPWP